MYEMKILGQQGDVKVEWDPADSRSVEQAARMFEDLLEQGYNAYSTSGRRRTRVTKFNPKAGSLLMAPGAQPQGSGAKPAALAGGPPTAGAR
jgi:hypothetical protein